MTTTCPTVCIKSKSQRGFVIINKSDFDPKTMELWDKPPNVIVMKPAPKKKSGKVSEK